MGTERPDSSDKGGGRDMPKPLHSVAWKPQLSMLSPKQLREVCNANDHGIVEDAGIGDEYSRLDTILRESTRRKLNQLDEPHWSALPPYMKEYYTESGDSDLVVHLKDLVKYRPSWQFFIDVLHDLGPILQQKVDGDHLVRLRNGARQFLDQLVRPTWGSGQLRKYLELSTHQNPLQKILHVGPSSEGMGLYILSVLEDIENQTGGCAFSQYTFANSSSDFGETVFSKIPAFHDRMKFETLVIAQDTTLQGFPEFSYDMIVASTILDPSIKLATALQTFQRLLKPGGKLIVSELAATNSFAINLALDLVPNRLESEGRSEEASAYASEAQWDQILKCNGFSGNDMTTRGYASAELHVTNIVVSAAQVGSTTGSQKLRQRVQIGIDDTSEYQKDLALQLHNNLVDVPASRRGIVSLAEAVESPDAVAHIIFLADTTGRHLARASLDDLSRIRGLTHRCNDLIWITRSGNSYDPLLEIPSYHGLKDGLLRTLRAEFNSKRIVSLNMEVDDELLNDSAMSILKILDVTLDAPTESFEPEYIMRNGMFFSGRLVEEREIYADVFASIVPQKISESCLPGSKIKVGSSDLSSPETNRFAEEPAFPKKLALENVETEGESWDIKPPGLHRARCQTTWSLEKDGAYLVAGGFGGIGRAVLKWLATKGAKHLIVPSRSGAVSQDAIQVVNELGAYGVSVAAPVCDCSSKVMLSRVLGECSNTMPPIRGCIIASMVLNDSPFDTMTHGQWESTIRSKVDVSWNLHTLLPRSLDFFVMLSSIAGVIGNPGQANYNAGCTFQDALARYRVRRGQKAMSIDLGVTRDIGIVAENEILRAALAKSPRFLDIAGRELFAVLDKYCDPGLGLLASDRTQLSMGIATPRDALQRGVEPAESMRSPLDAHYL
ncbi:KR domain-containing protein [Poronia punctata]|nr:KR domain-containing protein [Poronia punctata]